MIFHFHSFDIALKKTRTGPFVSLHCVKSFEVDKHISYLKYLQRHSAQVRKEINEDGFFT